MEEPDFSGWATKNGLKCSDGRTIMPDAFKHNNAQTVPLVWQHMHSEPTNILGHAILENREEGVYAYGFFNETAAGAHAKGMVQHGDISALSIYANNLSQRGDNVFHGDIREVSLVMAGANPGAMIENVNIKHGDGLQTLDDEALIFTGEEIYHSEEDEGDEVPTAANTVTHADGEEETVADVLDTMTDKQKDVVNFLVGAALEGQEADDSDSAEHSNTNSESLAHQEGTTMPRNVFEQNGKTATAAPTLSHSDVKAIVADAQKTGSFKESFLAHVEAQNYGIENIDVLFPDAKLTGDIETISRRMEWVAGIINGARHSPFSRIKSVAADLTADEARAKGYVKGNKKKDEIVKLLKRVTTPTTIYKKQKLDRDDIVDITDLNVVVWLKAEMRLMLDEELARAILIGDGREVDDEDKIDEDHLRPIAFDDDMYAHNITVPANIDPEGIVESILRTRTYYKGTGTPTLYTTDAILTDLILTKDKVGRRLYETEAALAAALRVKEIVVVEAMESVPNVLGIVVNMGDYTLGADKGGEVNMFDDFDIDYNQYKYLIETRVSGALTKPKSAIVVKRAVGNVVSPVVPSYDPETHIITIPTAAGVEYSINGIVKTGTVGITETTEVEANPAEGYSFPHNTDSDWTFTYTA